MEQKEYKLNSALGKKILALIRDGEFAHPGEKEAIQMVFSDLYSSTKRMFLDVGSGLGGTANVVQEQLNLGRVVGVEVDSKSVQIAQEKYPNINFIVGDATKISQVFPELRFDLIYMFNVLYTIKDQQRALYEMAKIAKPETELRIFDYCVFEDPLKAALAKKFAEAYSGSHWDPINFDQIESIFSSAGWRITKKIDITANYETWYKKFLDMLEEKKDQIIKVSDLGWYHHVLEKFSSFYHASRDGYIGGMIVHAKLST